MNNKSKIKYLILITVLISLVLPRPAFAFLGTGIFDLTKTLLQGLNTILGPILTWQILILIFHIVSLSFLSFTTGLLDSAIQGSFQWLTVNNAMVQAGWQFTAGIANLFIVLALIVLAFGFILKIESFEAKKVLPRLIIVALLVNFSLVFIGALIDITNILYRTIFNIAGPNLIADTVLPLKMVGAEIIGTLFTIFSSYVIASLIPFLSPFKFVQLILPTLSVAFIPVAFHWLISGLISFTMAGIFLVYAFIFSARVFIIQMLAIVAPIIFLTWAFPSLKKYWDEWLSHLLEWLVFGVVLYFFMVIGMKMANFLMPSTLSFLSIFIPGLNFWTVSPILVYYFFLFVYLVVIIYFGRRLTPNIGSALVRTGVVWAGAITAATLPLLTGLRYEAGLTARRAREEEKERYKKKQEEYEQEAATQAEGSAQKDYWLGMAEKYDWSKRHKLSKEEKKEVSGGFFARMGGGLVTLEEGINRMQGTTIEEKERQEILGAKAAAEKTKSFGRLQQLADDFERRGLTDVSNVFLAEIENRAQGIGHTNTEKVREKYKDEIPRRIQASLRVGDVDTTEILGRNMELKDFLKAYGRLTNKERRERAEEIYNKLTPEEISKFNKEIGMPEETSEEEKKENLLRVAHHLRMTDVSEMGHWLPKSMETMVPLIPHALNFEQRLAAIKQFRLPFARALSEDFDEKGLGNLVLNLPHEELATYSHYASSMTGGPSLKVADKPLQILQAQREGFKPDQLEFAREFEKLFPPELKGKLAEFLRTFPERLHELGSQDSAEKLRGEIRKGGPGEETEPPKKKYPYPGEM
ncbi:hypothetical protein KKH59_00570 [Patescibacteria group bacterium]|nr:hypothetical protein [Patescibacteria group bacterium]